MDRYGRDVWLSLAFGRAGAAARGNGSDKLLLEVSKRVQKPRPVSHRMTSDHNSISYRHIIIMPPSQSAPTYTDSLTV